MRTRSKLILTGLAATLLMAFAVNTATASRLSVSNGNLFRAYWPSLRFGAFGITAADCTVTLDGSFHSATFAKVNRALVGHITLASVGRCVTGSATVLTDRLPWHLQYGGFLGSLPQPRPILRLVGAQFRLSTGCLTTTTEERPALGIVEPTYNERNNGDANVLRADEVPTIACGGLNGSFSNRASVHALPGTATRVLVRLI
jgi:hypothetical protein